MTHNEALVRSILIVYSCEVYETHFVSKKNTLFGKDKISCVKSVIFAMFSHAKDATNS